MTVLGHCSSGKRSIYRCFYYFDRSTHASEYFKGARGRCPETMPSLDQKPLADSTSDLYALSSICCVAPDEHHIETRVFIAQLYQNSSYSTYIQDWQWKVLWVLPLLQPQGVLYITYHRNDLMSLHKDKEVCYAQCSGRLAAPPAVRQGWILFIRVDTMRSFGGTNTS